MAPTTSESPLPAAVERYMGMVEVSVGTRQSLYKGFFLAVIIASLYWSYTLRVFGLPVFGSHLALNDPYFNFRATEYLEAHGWNAFFHWYDYMSWYPIGRPVGTTIYPGLQITAVTLYRALNSFGIHMSLNDVCVMIPAWFGVAGTLLVAAIGNEVGLSLASSAIASLLYSIIPAHTMHSMAGSFDNECVAVPAMLLTFYLWVRSLRTSRSWPIGVLAGLAYGYMVAAWGGSAFVLNVIAAHSVTAAAVDWARNTYSPSLLKAYTLFFIVGTAIAVCVPPVQLAPLASLEQLGGIAALVFLWAFHFTETTSAATPPAEGSSTHRHDRAFVRQRVRAIGAVSVVMTSALMGASQAGYIAGLSPQASAVFRTPAPTGDPLRDGILQQQCTMALVQIFNMLNVSYFGTMIGLPALLTTLTQGYHPGMLLVVIFVVASAAVSYGVLRGAVFLAPGACLLTGYVMGWCFDLLASASFFVPPDESGATDTATASPSDASTAAAPEQQQHQQKQRPSAKEASKSQRKKKQGAGDHQEDEAAPEEAAESPMDAMDFAKKVKEWYANVRATKPTTALLYASIPLACAFFSVNVLGLLESAVYAAGDVAVPGVVFPNYTEADGMVIVEDYLQSYHWLRDNTPADARILAWWDYGYQIASIANRTTLADGNLWNSEHVAMIGKMLTSPVEEAHGLIRHMADYVYVRAGRGVNDLQKSHAMAVIANTVYGDICPGDERCDRFGFQGTSRLRPSPLMRRSLIYNLHDNGVSDTAHVDPALFEEVYSSPNGLVRVYRVVNVDEESKKWVADPVNRMCDPPGSWLCRGQYPPAEPIQQMLGRQHTEWESWNEYVREEQRQEEETENEANDGEEEVAQRRRGNAIVEEEVDDE